MFPPKSGATTMNTDLIPKEGLLLAAVSGGRDSMYLLHRLLELFPDRVACAHFDHRLRGTESDRDRRFVEKHCAALRIPCRIGSGNVAAFAAERGLSTEEAAREMRYAFLQDAAGNLGAKCILTAHTAEDNAETLLLNLARGTGLRGLCGIPPVRGNILRPLLEVTRQEIDTYINNNAIPFVEDSTNAEDAYARNRLRHSALPALESVNPAFAENICRTVRLLREDEACLNALAEDYLRSHPVPTVSSLLALPGPVRARVLRLFIGGDLSAVHVEAVEALLRGKPLGELSLPGHTLRRERDTLLLDQPEITPFPAFSLAPGESFVLPGGKWRFKCELTENNGKNSKDIHKLFFNYENICGKITVRPRREGDAFRPADRGCTKTLKNLFSEAKLTRAQRAQVPVVCDEAGVLGVFGFGVDRRCAPVPGCRILKIERMGSWE